MQQFLADIAGAYITLAAIAIMLHAVYRIISR